MLHQDGYKNKVNAQQVKRKEFEEICKERAIREGMETDPLITDPTSYYYQKLALYAQDHYQYKECKYCL